MNIVALSIVLLLIYAEYLFALPTCEDIQFLYPKADTIIDSAIEKSLYLILGNTNEDYKLRKVSLVHFNKDEATEKAIDSIYEGDESLYRITSVQKKLDGHTFSSNKAESFCFRILVDHNGQECQQDSGTFSIVNNN